MRARLRADRKGMILEPFPGFLDGVRSLGGVIAPSLTMGAQVFVALGNSRDWASVTAARMPSGRRT
jgi:hypothetical protein